MCLGMGWCPHRCSGLTTGSVPMRLIPGGLSQTKPRSVIAGHTPSLLDYFSSPDAFIFIDQNMSCFRSVCLLCTKESTEDEIERGIAALKIQAVYRGQRARREVKKLRTEKADEKWEDQPHWHSSPPQNTWKNNQIHRLMIVIFPKGDLM